MIEIVASVTCLVIAGGLLCSTTTVSAQEDSPKANGSLYDLANVVTVDGRSLSSFKGSVALVVNTASRCGFTYQLGDLQQLHEKYRKQGFTVLAFPSNDFGEQEPGTDEEIQTFCEAKYDTDFPLFPKAEVSGANKQAAFAYLTEQSGQKFAGDPGWNFVKFLVNRSGQVVDRFSSLTSPTGSAVTSAIERELAK